MLVMFRRSLLAALVSCIATAGWAQSPPAHPAPSAPAKPAAKKQAPKARPAAQQPAATESGPCQIGVISAIGDQLTVEHIGLTMLGNEFMEAPIEGWSLDDVVVARVRAAAPGTAVRKIAYPRGAFRPYDHPERKLFRNARDELTALVRQIAGNANCERYIVATKIELTLDATNQTLAGIGVYKGWASPSGRGVLVANFTLNVFDGQTFAILNVPSRDFGAVLAASLVGREGVRVLNDLEFPKTAEQATNNATLRDNARSLITEVLDKSLPRYLKAE